MKRRAGARVTQWFEEFYKKNMPTRRKATKTTATVVTKRRKVQDPVEESPSKMTRSSKESRPVAKVLEEEEESGPDTADVSMPTIEVAKKVPKKGESGRFSWTPELENKLIELWKNYPSLYDSSHSQHRDSELNFTIRSAIATKLDTTGRTQQ